MHAAIARVQERRRPSAGEEARGVVVTGRREGCREACDSGSAQGGHIQPERCLDMMMKDKERVSARMDSESFSITNNYCRLCYEVLQPNMTHEASGLVVNFVR